MANRTPATAAGAAELCTEATVANLMGMFEMVCWRSVIIPVLVLRPLQNNWAMCSKNPLAVYWQRLQALAEACVPRSAARRRHCAQRTR